MKRIGSGLIALALAAFALPAVAEPSSQTLFTHKHWEVEIVGFDDGSFACLAEVDATTDSFTVWVYADQSVRLQFYSTSWEFGEGDTADLQVQIGRRSPWNLTGAELYKNSILFDLPDSNQGVNFLVDSLAGSQASMNALIECADALKGNSTNPFN